MKVGPRVPKTWLRGPPSPGVQKIGTGADCCGGVLRGMPVQEYQGGSQADYMDTSLDASMPSSEPVRQFITSFAKLWIRRAPLSSCVWDYLPILIPSIIHQHPHPQPPGPRTSQMHGKLRKSMKIHVLQPAASEQRFVIGEPIRCHKGSQGLPGPPRASQGLRHSGSWTS